MTEQGNDFYKTMRKASAGWLMTTLKAAKNLRINTKFNWRDMHKEYPILTEEQLKSAPEIEKMREEWDKRHPSTEFKKQVVAKYIKGSK